MLGTLPICGRIVDLGRRSAFSSERITIAVKNMPKNDPENYGRSKDLVAMIAEVMDIQIASLDMTQQAVERADHYFHMLHKNAEVFRELEQRFLEHNKAGEFIIDHVSSALEDSFLFLGLTESQEHYLQNLMRETAKKAQAVYDDAHKTLIFTKSVADELKAILQQQQAVQADVIAETSANTELF